MFIKSTAFKYAAVVLAGGVVSLCGYFLSTLKEKTERDMMEEDLKGYIDQQVSARIYDLSSNEDEDTTEEG